MKIIVRLRLFFAAFLMASSLSAQISSSNAAATLSIVGPDYVSLSAANESGPSFTVKVAALDGSPIAGITVSFFANVLGCFDGDPHCVIPPANLYGTFPNGSANAVTDANGLATGSGFVGGSVSGLYSAVATIPFGVSPANSALLSSGSLYVEYVINQSIASGPFGIQTGITGSWYDPMYSGQGLSFEVINTQSIAAYFYTFDSMGHNLWLTGVLYINGGTAAGTLAQTDGGFFPPNFDSKNIVRSTWGTLTVTFSDCSHATAQWTVAPEKQSSFSDGSLSLQRITAIPGLTCH